MKTKQNILATGIKIAEEANLLKSVGHLLKSIDYLVVGRRSTKSLRLVSQVAGK